MTTNEHPIGIPTRYRGRNYRSRLEARWACFFDLVGWRYEYEPCDFEGWIPDFVLCETQTTFVEVKPVVTFPDEVAAKIDATSCLQEVLIVGMALLKGQCPWSDRPYLGWLREYSDGCGGECEHGVDWDLAPMGIWTPATLYAPRVGFCHDTGSYRDRITGLYDGGCIGAGDPRLSIETVHALWARAGNETQWRKV